MAMPLFIFAATACRVLEDHRWDPIDSLKEILEHQHENLQLSGTYLPILKRILMDPSPQRQNKLVQTFRQMVGVIVVLESPLSITSLSKLIDIEERNVRIILDLLHSVLNIPHDTSKPVRLFHLSFRDFLLDPATKTDFSVMIDSQQGLQENICELSSYGTSSDQIEAQKRDVRISAELRYSTRYWVDHLHQGTVVLSDHDKIHGFLKKHFLHWLELMSILGYLPEALDKINALQTMVQLSIIISR
ncbi:WD domain-containing protein [Aspergillus ellipticus CBS 707.79]|uniref:WD domain-containing protein n=1 Tax=Aspergillus ellipticus CBS 707.79 TaxID=1448320 RepID=A0A319DI06_9EURO|nr:WD domain-containing protein [Aspergillus ellipticus CBS 707.79]